MNLWTLKICRIFHLISKVKYDEKRQIEIVKASPLFDAKWYLEQNPDVKAKKIGAARHYVKWGWKEGRNPGKAFDTKAYLEQYPELLEKNWCPLFHYMLAHKELMQKVNNKIKEKKTKNKLNMKKQTNKLLNTEYTYNPFSCFARNIYYNDKKPEGFTYNNAVILPLKARPNTVLYKGGVVDAEGNYIEASSLQPNNEIIFDNYKYDVINNCNMNVIYIGGFWNHWGHFIIELTSRLWYVLENDKNHTLKLAYSMISNLPLPQAYLDFFHLLGIKDEQLLQVKEPTRFKSVVVPEVSTVHALWYTKEFKNIYDKIMKNIVPVYHDKIYFSRTKFPKAINSEFGETLIEKSFAQNGYTIVYPETLSLTEQLSLIKGCKNFAMVSGTLCHNMLFADDGAEVIILEKSSIRNPIQLLINKMRNLNVTYIDCFLEMKHVDLGTGPFLLVPNNNFCSFFKKHNYHLKNTERNVRKNIENYIKKYKEFAKQGKLSKKISEDETEEIISQFRKQVFRKCKLNLMPNNVINFGQYFDEMYYLEHYPEVKTSGMSAVEHFMCEGWKKGYNPSQNFNINFYLETYKDIARAGINPLLHYIQYGKIEGRRVNSGFNSEKIKGSADYELIFRSKYFDKHWYLKTYPDVKKAGVDPVKHYLQFGWKEGRNPSKKFSTNDYLDLNADVKRAKINPLLHYEKYGKKEGRKFQNQKCSPAFYKLAQFIRTFKNKKIKKIILFSHELTYTGAPLSLLKAAECLKELDYQIIVISIKDGPLAAEFKKIGKVFISNNLNKSCLIASFCDFAIINTITLYNEYNTLKKLIPTVWWIREPVSLLENNICMKLSLMNADNIYAMSEFSRDEYLPYNSKIKVIKHGLDDYYNDKTINATRPHFAVIGSIDYRKGQDVFIEAVNKLPKSLREKADFSIVGKIHDRKILSMNKDNSIHIIPETTDYNKMMKFYENISCLVVPSRQEPTSRTAIEAMMMGRPVIISDQVGAKYLIDENKNGFIFQNENSEQLSLLMADIIKHPSILIPMEQKARNAYKKNNAPDVYKKALNTMIKDTLDNYSKQKILVHLHLYYHDQLDWFLSKLKNITCPYDLLVTVVESNSISYAKLLKFKPDTQIIKVKNYGYDVYPFWQVLQKINLSDYRYVLKIHTKNRREDTWKKDGGVTYTQYQWRNDLIDPLIGSKTCFRKTLKIFDKKPYVGMIGAKNLLRTKDSLAYISDTQKICEKFNILYQEAPFVCGTMFMVRSWILNKFKNYPFKDNDFSAIALTGQTDSLAHRMEVVFGILNAYYGYTLCGVQNFRTLCRLMKAKIYKYFEPKRKSYKTNEEYIQHSKYFDKKWYLKTYPDVKKSGIDPVEHYLKSGWKEGRNPGPKFNTNWYLNRYKDVKEAKINPLVHYEKHGKYEGRSLKSNNIISSLNMLNKISKNTARGITYKKRHLKIIVSLTSYPARIDEVPYTIHSLLEQSLKPDEIILWLGHDKFPNKEKDLPEMLLNLCKRGLTIKWCKDIRSYTKLIPALKLHPDDIIVTADDDIYYPKDWLEKLYQSYQKHPAEIHCHRIHKITFDSQRHILPYKEWIQCYMTDYPAYTNFLTGVGGVLYPPHSLYKDVLKSSLFLKLAPYADDIWFWAMAVMKGTKIRNIKKGYSKLTYVNPEREYGIIEGATLAAENVVNGKNDEQLKKILKRYPELYKKLNAMAE